VTHPGSCSDAGFLSSFDGFELLPHIVRLIARGQPVSLDDIAEAAQRSRDDVDSVLRAQAGTDWDDDGRLLGLGLTLRPTAHRFTIPGRTLYAWCATDTFYFAILLDIPALVESTCPATGQAIRLELEPDGIIGVKPSQTVVSQRHCADLVNDIRAQVCDQGNFYSSADAAAAWLSEHPDGELLSVAETFERCRTTCRQFGWTKQPTP
jgi:alkylmercury lyase